MRCADPIAGDIRRVPAGFSLVLARRPPTAYVSDHIQRGVRGRICVPTFNMALTAGTRIGPYEVVAPLGAGGMGEVYRARDARLNRDVAIKVLPEAFALDPERLARFRREAQVLAALNHPHIAAIHGLEEAGGVQALVLELVEGPTLADRIAQGPLPLDEALPIAKQIADALEAAHEQGIIHRDLKPANIKITPDGVVKVLDFGLAKLTTTEDVGRGPRSGPAGAADLLSQSPTITSPAMRTGAGMILGTAAYMAPEQAKGRPADKRSDVWAFGCVLYEMLTGRRAFEGDDVSDTMAAVLRAEPDWSALPAGTPPLVVRLLRGCLQKDRRKRVSDIAVARFELDAPVGGSDAAPAQSGGRVRERVAWACVAALLLAGAAATMYVALRPPAPSPPRIVFSLDPPEGLTFGVGSPALTYPTISPDGRQLAFVLRGPTGRLQLGIRMLDSFDARLLPGTEAPTSPFWSPDSRAIAFFSGGQLKKVDVSGGTPQVVCPGSDAAGGTWNADGTILFTGSTGALFRVAAAGGEPAPVTTLDAVQKEASHRAPWFLPGGRRFLYLVQPSNTIFVGSLDSAERTEVARADSKAMYAATGHILFSRNSNLMAQPFNADQAEVTGEMMPVAADVGALANGKSAFSVSDNGTLVYYTGGAALSQPAWFDRSGKFLGNIGEEGLYRQVALAPDGTKIAAEIFDTRGSQDIWVLDNRGISTRLTFERSLDPVWSPDSRELAFNRANGNRVIRKAVDGSQEVVVWEGSTSRFPESWSRDGRLLAYNTLGSTLGTLPLTPDAQALVWLDTPFTKDEPQFSPDGRWMAYQSNESGELEVFVQAFPGPGQKRRISTDGGGLPRWRADGRELFYLTPTGLMMGVPMTTGAALEPGTPEPLFQTAIRTPGLGIDLYDVTADGQRFLVLTPTNARQTPITVVVNWTAGMNER